MILETLSGGTLLDLFLKTWQQRAVARIIIGIGAMIAGIAFASWFVRNSPPLDLAPRFFLYMWFGIGLGGGALFFFVGLYHVAKSLKAFRGNCRPALQYALRYRFIHSLPGSFSQLPGHGSVLPNRDGSGRIQRRQLA
ncbi:MAG: hypothetical protein MSC45_09215 [Mobiluncus sp.]|uniref:hypothetical protein n=1 Tax=Mobiluncus sp. TaxID=47293 RepID=UPI00258F52D2|nr:hypothetical protein [Mobiluncus sp.]MCI6585228.1 hypothetical protein [Mobiluncus sp.]